MSTLSSIVRTFGYWPTMFLLAAASSGGFLLAHEILNQLTKG